MSIIYLCPNSNVASGGVRVIYRHSELLVQNGFDSSIFHPYDPEFSCSWFEHNARLCKSATFNPQKDLIIIPEAWAERFGKQCMDAGIKFGIFVQNGYYIQPQKDSTDLTGSALRKVYAAADIVLSISEDATASISLTYPFVPASKIMRLLPNIGDIFCNPIDWSKKEQLLTYMPRKLSEHSSFLRYILEQYLPKGWEMKPIENMNFGSELASLLSRSSIFLSFCDREGCPLPPLEAAFSGNVVVGYTGQGAKEYFFRPLFREIHNGDYRGYVENARDAINEIGEGLFDSAGFRNQIDALKSFYAVNNELSYLMRFAKRAGEIVSL
jgi:hypothetical protein